MTPTQTLTKLTQIYEAALGILESQLPEETKYSLVFSDKISRQVRQICSDSIFRDFHYYDPDAGYEDDVRAFVQGLDDYIQGAEGFLQSSPSLDSVMAKYEAL